MKKLFAILLLSVHLFNLAGYSLLFQHLIRQSDTQLVTQLNNNRYSDKDLIEVKVPLNMPYISSTGSFERVDGQLEHNGVHYNYVKRKVANDTLYLMCVPNVSKTQLYAAKAAYSREANDIPSGKKSTEAVKKAGFANEYSYMSHAYTAPLLMAASAIKYFTPSATLREVFLSIPAQPPRAGC